jgi:[acyl-carrier-protein] S-malonyltransferase
VRFDRCLATVAAKEPSAVLELAPGGTLAALVKRAVPGVAITALKTAADAASVTA